MAGRGTVLAEAGEEGVRCQISPCLSQRGDRKEEIGEGKKRRRRERRGEEFIGHITNSMTMVLI